MPGMPPFFMGRFGGAHGDSEEDDEEEEDEESEEPYEEVAAPPGVHLPSDEAVERATLEILRGG